METIVKKERRCKECYQVLNPNYNQKVVRKNRLFCNSKCRDRYFQRRRYHEIKDTPEFKEKRKIYFRKWVAANRLHFNAMISRYMRERRLADKERVLVEYIVALEGLDLNKKN